MSSPPPTPPEMAVPAGAVANLVLRAHLADEEPACLRPTGPGRHPGPVSGPEHDRLRIPNPPKSMLKPKKKAKARRRKPPPPYRA